MTFNEASRIDVRNILFLTFTREEWKTFYAISHFSIDRVL